MYDQSTCNVLHKNQVSEPIPVLSGVKQGCVLSPLLFNVTLDQCFSTAGPRPGTGPWHQLYWAARGLRKL